MIGTRRLQRRSDGGASVSTGAVSTAVLAPVGGVLGAGISRQLLLLAATTAVAFVATWGVASGTGAGLAFRAWSDDPPSAAAAGVRSAWISRSAWAAAALLGGLAGILQAPIHGSFYPGFMTIETLLPALTAALLGGVTSIVGAFAAGEIVGVVQSLGGYLLGQRHGIPGAANVTVFVLLVAVMLWRGSDDRVPARAFA